MIAILKLLLSSWARARLRAPAEADRSHHERVYRGYTEHYCLNSGCIRPIDQLIDNMTTSGRDDPPGGDAGEYALSVLGEDPDQNEEKLRECEKKMFEEIRKFRSSIGLGALPAHQCFRVRKSHGTEQLGLCPATSKKDEDGVFTGLCSGHGSAKVHKYIMLKLADWSDEMKR